MLRGLCEYVMNLILLCLHFFLYLCITKNSWSIFWILCYILVAQGRYDILPSAHILDKEVDIETED